MACYDEGVFYPTKSLVSGNGRKRYPIPVKSQHWQLRSLISVEKCHVVYFPGGDESNHIQRLDTQHKECETLKILTFAPRCLVARNGWLCCGSENGEFAAIRLDDVPELRPSTPSIRSETENLQQEGLARSYRLDAGRPGKTLKAKTMKLAQDRVNCVTLWFPPSSDKEAQSPEGVYSEAVAVLANNDKTVVLVSLQDFDAHEEVNPLDVIEYPDFVNRATISPDGRMLVGILDDPYLYIHERVGRGSGSTTSRNGEEYWWELKQRILLKSQKKDDISDSRGSFAACFSPSGAYLAIGTQHGTICIFDTNLLLDPFAEPLITTFQSSRPESASGAVRDMAFCPGPFDILAWTEDRGHVGFADMRTKCIVRQIVDIGSEIDFQDTGISHCSTFDAVLLSMMERHQSTRSPSADAARASLAGEDLENLNRPFNASETVVLDAIQDDRRRRRAEPEPATSSDEPPRGVWQVVYPSTNDDDSQRPRRRSISAGRGGMFAYLGYQREQRERQLQLRQDRAAHARRTPAAGTDGARRFDPRWMESLGETVRVMRENGGRQESTYLNMLEFLQGRERSSNDGENEDTSLLVPLVNQVRWNENAIPTTLPPDRGVFDTPPSADNTSGLAWSEDGRILFVGAQNGIYELRINVHGRKFCPSIAVR